MGSRFRGHLDALVKGAEIILKGARGSISGTHYAEANQSDGYRYLSIHPSETGNVNITGENVNSRFELPQILRTYMGFSRRDEAIIIGNSSYFELWKLIDLKKYIESNPFTIEDAEALSQMELTISANQPTL